MQDHETRSDDSVRASIQEKETELHLVDSRLQKVEESITDARSRVEEIPRLRNELMLEFQEFAQRLDERVHEWHGESDRVVPKLLRETEATCARIGDDAMGAAEAAQRKVGDFARHLEASQSRIEEVARRTEELTRHAQAVHCKFDDVTRLTEMLQRKIEELARHADAAHSKSDNATRSAETLERKFEEVGRHTDSSLDKLRADISLLNSELTNMKVPQAPSMASAPLSVKSVSRAEKLSQDTQSINSLPSETGEVFDEHAVTVIVDTLEKRLSKRLGKQVQQLGDVVRRVVEAQATLQKQQSAPKQFSVRPASCTSTSASDSVHEFAPGLRFSHCADESEVRDLRRQAIDKLHKELRHPEAPIVDSLNSHINTKPSPRSMVYSRGDESAIRAKTRPLRASHRSASVGRNCGPPTRMS